MEGYAYGLMAWLSAGDADYNDEINGAISYLESQQAEGGYWDGGWGYYADTTSAALLALSMANARHSLDDSVMEVTGSVISNAVSYLEGQILADGTLPGDNGGSEGNANTTAMAALALKAAGEEPSALTHTDSTNTLLQGLLLFAVGDDSGFVYSNSYGNTYNDYATKQAFLGLIAATAPQAAIISWTLPALPCRGRPRPWPAAVRSPSRVLRPTLRFTVKLDSAVQTPLSAGKYDLPAGTDTYTVSKSGYETGPDSFTITAEEAENHTVRQISFTLSAEEVESSDEYLYITVNGPSGRILSRRSMVWSSGMTPLSALLNTGLSVEYDDGYVSSIAGVAEFDYGTNSGWCYQVNGDQDILESADVYELGADDELVWYYTYDYAEDSDWDDGSTSSAVTGTQTPDLGYGDVEEQDWFYEAVNWAVEQGLYKGVSETEFLPDGEMTRGMLATVLWRFAGESAADGEAVFSDVPDGAWYTGAVNWASGNGLMGGYGNGQFGSGDLLTNEQLAAVLWRYAGSPAAEETSTPEGTSSWAAEAMRWAAENDLFYGEDGTETVPVSLVTRAEAADILMRFAALMEGAG